VGAAALAAAAQFFGSRMGDHPHQRVALLLDQLLRRHEREIVVDLGHVVDIDDLDHLLLGFALDDRHIVDVQHADLELARDHRRADVGAERHLLRVLRRELAFAHHDVEGDGTRTAERIDPDGLALHVLALGDRRVERADQPVRLLVAVDRYQPHVRVVRHHGDDERRRRHGKVDIARGDGARRRRA
jgi:hypothetical protein